MSTCLFCSDFYFAVLVVATRTHHSQWTVRMELLKVELLHSAAHILFTVLSFLFLQSRSSLHWSTTRFKSLFLLHTHWYSTDYTSKYSSIAQYRLCFYGSHVCLVRRHANTAIPCHFDCNLDRRLPVASSPPEFSFLGCYNDSKEEPVLNGGVLKRKYVMTTEVRVMCNI